MASIITGATRIVISVDEDYVCNDFLTSGDTLTHVATNYYEFYERKELVASVQVCDTHAKDAFSMAELIIERYEDDA